MKNKKLQRQLLYFLIIGFSAFIIDYSFLIIFKEYKPSIFFGIIGMIFLLISLGFGIPVFVEYFKTHLVKRFPTLIFAGFMLMISVMSFTCGIMLEVIVKKHRQLFELFLVKNKK